MAVRRPRSRRWRRPAAAAHSSRRRRILSINPARRQDEWRQADKDLLKPIAELDGSGNLTARFVYGSKTNTPDVILKYNGGLVTTYRVISDHLGSPIMAVNVNNSSDVPFAAEYSAFGERTVSSGAASESWMPFGFTGGLYDADTKLTRLGAWDYDAVTGRWTHKDPILFDGGQANLYVNSGNDPVNRRDPNGAIWIVDMAMCGYYYLQVSDTIDECSREYANAC